ncbi:extracellular solute-binding protein [Nonomuraea recticatena]|uniref:extracellular solute-binding protein n=1 Tax=Nonomuraea recticatena TaxID=46178 RepID=UPI00361E31B6
MSTYVNRRRSDATSSARGRDCHGARRHPGRLRLRRGSGDDALEIWIRQAPDSDSAKTAVKLADAFTKASGVKTKVVALFDDFETKLQQQAAQKNLPDIVINDTAQLGNMQSQGWLRPVDKAKLKGGDQLADRAWQAAAAGDGKHYAAPFSAQAFALIIRKDWRRRSAWSPRRPGTISASWPRPSPRTTPTATGRRTPSASSPRRAPSAATRPGTPPR